MVKPMVVLEKFVKPLQPLDFRWFKFNASEEMASPANVVSSDDSSDSSSDSSSEEEVVEPRPKTSKVDLGHMGDGRSPGGTISFGCSCTGQGWRR